MAAVSSRTRRKKAVLADAYRCTKFAPWGPWRDGVNYSLPAEEVSPAGLYDMENCTVGLAGEVKKRKGYAKFNASAMNSGATVTALGQVVLAGVEKVFAFCGDKFFDVTGGTATDRTGSATVTAGNDNTWNWVLAGSTLVAANGVDTDAVTWAGGTNNIAALDDDSRLLSRRGLPFGKTAFGWAMRTATATAYGAAPPVTSRPGALWTTTLSATRSPAYSLFRTRSPSIRNTASIR